MTAGHNETAVRLGLLANDAKLALDRVANGEGEAIEGWLAYGAALNDGRALFPSDEQFGQWVAESGLSQVGTHEIKRDDRAAAMWAAAEPEQFAEARAAGNARTVRGIHAAWKELQREREAETALAEVKAARQKADDDANSADKMRKEVETQPDGADRQELEKEAEALAKQALESEAEADVAEEELVSVADPQKTMPPATAHVSHNSGNNEWYTPASFVDAARAVMGGIDLDPASSEIANRVVQATQIFTANDDGLEQEWPVCRIFMNPPYAQPLMGKFASRFAAEIQKGSEGVALVNNATETFWFQEIAAECSAICFPKTRIRFLDPEGNPGAPLQGQAIIYCGENTDKFIQEFSAFGLVVLHGV